MIPVRMVEAASTAEAWEKAIQIVLSDGVTLETQYDVDPNTGHRWEPSKDLTMTMVVQDALAEPRLHVRMGGSAVEFGDYRAEVVEGIKDTWVRKDPSELAWPYTYHDRFTNWGGRLNFAAPGLFEAEKPLSGLTPDPANPWVGIGLVRWMKDQQEESVPVVQELDPFDQVQYIVKTLADAPFSRRAIAMTGFPIGDSQTSDPPCLRYIWCRGIYEGHLKIDLHSHWRSRDAWGAAGFNMFALTEWQGEIAAAVQERIIERIEGKDSVDCPICGQAIRSSEMARGEGNDRTEMGFFCLHCKAYPFLVSAGGYVDISDSFHIYGKDRDDVEKRFLPSLDLPFEKRFWNLNQSPHREMLEEGREKALNLVARRDEGVPHHNEILKGGIYLGIDAEKDWEIGVD